MSPSIIKTIDFSSDGDIEKDDAPELTVFHSKSFVKESAGTIMFNSDVFSGPVSKRITFPPTSIAIMLPSAEIDAFLGPSFLKEVIFLLFIFVFIE